MNQPPRKRWKIRPLWIGALLVLLIILAPCMVAWEAHRQRRVVEDLEERGATVLTEDDYNGYATESTFTVWFDVRYLSRVCAIWWTEMDQSDLAWATQFPNLERLDVQSISPEGLTDISHVASLSHLESVSLSNGTFTDISPLAQCRNLRRISNYRQSR